MESIRKQNPGLFVILVAALLITACARKETAPPDSPEAVVQALYEVSAKAGIPKDQTKLSQYFDGRLTELLVKDFSCIENGKKCGILYYDPVAQSKEPEIEDLEIFKPEDGHDVFVAFNQRDLQYKAICIMLKTQAGWRISDIVMYGAEEMLAPGASLLTALSLQIKPPPPWHPPVPGLPESLAK